MNQVFPWVVEHRRVPALTMGYCTIKVLVSIAIAIFIKLWQKWIRLKQAVDIAPIHTIFSEVMVLAVANRDVFTDGDSIEVLSLQKHVVAVEADSMTLVVRGLFSTQDTFVTGIGVRHSKL